MKLYLSSYHFGDEPEKLKELVAETHTGRNRWKVGIIPNAGDMHTPAEIMERYAMDAESFIGMGFLPALLDLKVFFGENQGLLADALQELDMVWVRGGNSFILRRAMYQSGFDQLITPLVEQNKLVYAGYSAGAVVATTNLRGTELIDDPDEIPEGYAAATPWDGLGFVPYSIAPHYKSDHPEAAMVDDVVAYYEAHSLPYKALHDGEVIVVNT